MRALAHIAAVVVAASTLASGCTRPAGSVSGDDAGAVLVLARPDGAADAAPEDDASGAPDASMPTPDEDMPQPVPRDATVAFGHIEGVHGSKSASQLYIAEKRPSGVRGTLSDLGANADPVYVLDHGTFSRKRAFAVQSGDFDELWRKAQRRKLLTQDPSPADKPGPDAGHCLLYFRWMDGGHRQTHALSYNCLAGPLAAGADEVSSYLRALAPPPRPAKRR